MKERTKSGADGGRKTIPKPGEGPARWPGFPKYLVIGLFAAWIGFVHFRYLQESFKNRYNFFKFIRIYQKYKQ
jgi:hypothetical protein